MLSPPGESAAVVCFVLEQKAEIELEVRAALAGQVERELAKRSFSGAMAYFVATLGTAWSTSYSAGPPGWLMVLAALPRAAGPAPTLRRCAPSCPPRAEVPGPKAAFLASLYG